MLSAAIAALACLCLARSSPTDTHTLRMYAKNPHSLQDISAVLVNIEERLRVLDVVSAVQAQQSRRLDVLQDKLDRVETTVSLKLERAQLASDRLEHRLHILQTSVLNTIKENSEKVIQSQLKIEEIAQNLTFDIESHRRLLEKVSGAYADTWRRSLLLENMMRNGLSVVNVTRRELADGLRGLARRQRDRKINPVDLEANLIRYLNETTYMIESKLEKVVDEQKRIVDSCHTVQQDDPIHVADVLDKLIDSLINKTAATFRELQNIQTTVRNHDNKIMKLLNTPRPTTQVDSSCRRLEGAFKNMSQSPFKESELQQLTEKFVALTNRADSALQRLEANMATIATTSPDTDAERHPTSDIASEANQLMLKLEGIRNEYNSEEDQNWEDYKMPKYRKGFYADDDYIDGDWKGMELMNGVRRGRQVAYDTHGPPRHPATTRPPHRRHLHKHPYDRGPIQKPSN